MLTQLFSASTFTVNDPDWACVGQLSEITQNTITKKLVAIAEGAKNLRSLVMEAPFPVMPGGWDHSYTGGCDVSVMFQQADLDCGRCRKKKRAESPPEAQRPVAHPMPLGQEFRQPTNCIVLRGVSLLSLASPSPDSGTCLISMDAFWHRGRRLPMPYLR